MKVKNALGLGMAIAFGFVTLATAENLVKKEDFETRMNANFVGINFFD